MTYPERLRVIQAEMSGQHIDMVKAIARKLHDMRGTPGYDEHHAIVSHAANNLLREHFATETADWTTAERIVAVRMMPNEQPDPVTRALFSSVERVLDQLLPGVGDEAIERFENETDSEGETWPAYLADAYTAALGEMSV